MVCFFSPIYDISVPSQGLGFIWMLVTPGTPVLIFSVLETGRNIMMLFTDSFEGIHLFYGIVVSPGPVTVTPVQNPDC